jgi:hypothetical protein
MTEKLRTTLLLQHRDGQWLASLPFAEFADGIFERARPKPLNAVLASQREVCGAMRSPEPVNSGRFPAEAVDRLACFLRGKHLRTRNGNSCGAWHRIPQLEALYGGGLRPSGLGDHDTVPSDVACELYARSESGTANWGAHHFQEAGQVSCRFGSEPPPVDLSAPVTWETNYAVPGVTNNPGRIVRMLSAHTGRFRPGFPTNGQVREFAGWLKESGLEVQATFDAGGGRVSDPVLLPENAGRNRYRLVLPKSAYGNEIPLELTLPEVKWNGDPLLPAMTMRATGRGMREILANVMATGAENFEVPFGGMVSDRFRIPGHILDTRKTKVPPTLDF